MRRSSLFLAVAAAGALAALPARANPMMVEGAHGVQVPGTFHAQVTYFCAEGVTACTPPTALARDGAPLAAAWQKGFVSTNLGSGVTGTTAWQVCDCGLPPGSYAYAITSPLSWGGGQPTVYQVAVAILDPPPGPPGPAPDPGGDVQPWDEPDPPWPQGLDCVAACAAPPEPVPDVPTPPADVPVPPADVPPPPVDLPVVTDLPVPDFARPDTAAPDVPAPVPDPGPRPDEGGGATCSASAAGSLSGALPALLALAALARPRRRRVGA